MKQRAIFIPYITFCMVINLSLLLAQDQSADQWLSKPVNNEIFLTYLDFFKYDTTLDFKETILAVETVEDLQRERLTFQSIPDMQVTAYLSYPAGQQITERPILVALHGGMGDGKDSNFNNSYFPTLVRAGWNIFAIDFLHFGERKTGLLTTFNELDKHENLYNNQSQYLSWIVQCVKDIGRAFDYLVKRRGMNGDRIGLLGMSRGAQVGMIAAAALQKFKAVVFFYGGHFDAAETGHAGAACQANYIGRINPVPLLMINGLYDNDYKKDTSVMPLYNIARQPKKIIWTNGGHMFASKENRAEIVHWLKKHLK